MSGWLRGLWRSLTEALAAFLAWPGLPWLGAVLLGALALWLAWRLVRVARRARLRRDPEEPPDPSGAHTEEVIDLTLRSSRPPLRRSFGRARAALGRLLPGPALYRRPWILIAGQALAGKSTLLDRSGLGLPYGQPRRAPGPEYPGVSWWAYGGGVVLDVSGSDLLREDGRTSDTSAWRSLLTEIRRARPRRPLDGIVLSLPASELVDPKKPIAQRMAEASKRAARLAVKLSQAQRRLGLRLPVYLLITHCDLLSGWRALPATLSQWRRQQIFGWSNPAAVDAAYTGAWVDRAFDTTLDELDAFELAALAAGEAAPEPELLLLGRRLDELREPLRIYANHLFRRQADSSPPLLRGIYFCGAASPPNGGDGFDPAQVAFVGELLDEKVFPETGLARPTERAVAAARLGRGALAALVLAVAAWVVLGFPGAARHSRQRALALAPLVERVASQLDRSASPPSPEGARALLSAAARVESFDLETAALPASHALPLPGEIARAPRRAFEQGVFPAIRDDLRRRGDALFDLPRARPEGAQPALRPVVRYRQFEALDRFTAQLAHLDELVARYRRFIPDRDDGVTWLARFRNLLARGDRAAEAGGGSGSGRLADLQELVVRTLGARFEPASAAAFEDLLGGVEAPPFDAAADDLAQRLRGEVLARADDLFDALFAHNPLATDLETAAMGLARLGPLRYPRADDVESYRQVLDGLRRIERALDVSALDWLAAERADLGSRFDDILARVHASPFLGPPVSDEIVDRLRRRFRAFQGDLTSYEYGVGLAAPRPLLVRADQAFRLSDTAQEIARSLRVILGEPFMRPPRVLAAPSAPGPGRILLWEKRPLEEAVALVRSWEAWQSGKQKILEGADIETLPEPIGESEPEVTQEAAASGVLELLEQARGWRERPAALDVSAREAALERRIDSLVAAAPELGSLLDGLDRLGLGAHAEELALEIRDQRVELLAEVGEVLDDLGPYQPRDRNLTWWDGRRPPALDAFGAPSEDDLPAILADRRQQVARLARELAAPLLGLLGDSGYESLAAATPEAPRWSAILTDLDEYASKTPGNPLATLEAFISGPMSEIDLWSCFAELDPKRAAGTPSDLFLARRAELERQLHRRCLELADRRGFTLYLDLAERFNRLLAGRFPFASTLVRLEAEPERLAEFFGAGREAVEASEPGDGVAALDTDFDRVLYLVGNLAAGDGCPPRCPDGDAADRVPPPSRFGELLGEVDAFLRQLAGVRDFLAGYLAADAKSDTPVFDLEARFRVLRETERNANQVIGWVLEVGDERLDLLASGSASPAGTAAAPPPPKVRWVYGKTPIDLVVRWASGSPFSPVAAEPVPRVTIDGKRLVYRYREPWSLLRLVADHLASAYDFERLDDPHPETLRLDVVTARDRSPSTRELATLYLRLALIDPATGLERRLPTFPRWAPSADRWWFGRAAAEPPGSTPEAGEAGDGGAQPAGSDDPSPGVEPPPGAPPTAAGAAGSASGQPSRAAPPEPAGASDPGASPSAAPSAPQPAPSDAEPTTDPDASEASPDEPPGGGDDDSELR